MTTVPSPESNPPPMSPTTPNELLSLHPSFTSLVIPDPSPETFGYSLQAPSFGGFVLGEVMGQGSFGRLICAEEVRLGISRSEIKDGEFLGDLGEGLRVGDVEVVVLDEFCGKNGTRGLARGSDETSLLEMKEKLVLGDIEEKFVEDGVGCRQESEISLLELKKKQLLHVLDHGCVFGEAVGAQVLENEDVYEGTLVLDKFCNVDGKEKVARELCADDFGKMKGGECGNDGFDLRRPLKIEVIDDTAVVQQVPICVVHSMVKKENEMPSSSKNQKEEVVDGKKARRARRKAKSLHRNEEILRKQEDVNAHFQNNQAGSKLMYSRVEMETLRYVNIVEQQRFWSQIYDGLGLVAKEYMSLLNGRAQPGTNVDCLQQSLRREQAPGILGELRQLTYICY